MEQAKIPYQLIRSDRKTVAIQITPDGTVLVRCPRRMSAQAAEEFVRSKRPWIEAHLKKRLSQPQLPRFTERQLQSLAREAAKLIPERVVFFEPLVGTDHQKITIRTQRSRWGSCSGKGNLSFNCLLMLAPGYVLDYVVVHELCHRKEMNHSKRFWAEVTRILPDYAQARAWLKENGNQLIGRL